MAELIYKICTRAEWDTALKEGAYRGSTVDLADGFIHFSTAAQARETAAKHFAGQADLLLIGVDPTKLPAAALKWEPSRGGDLFPHLYDTLNTDAAISMVALPWSDATGHRFPDAFPDG
ncbi:MAG: DUF952 domain-containing protein [Alphaproteobacteria bacterium]